MAKRIDEQDIGAVLRNAFRQSGRSIKSVSDEAHIPYAGLHGFLTGNADITTDLAQNWRELDLDEKTRALLVYTAKMTEFPALIEDADIDAMSEAGWDQRGIWEATVLISFFNMTGRIESASGMSEEVIPEGIEFPEAIPD